MRELPRRVGRRAGTATRPDHTDDRVALADVVVQQPQQGVGPRLLAKAALHPQFKAARLQVVRDRVARRAELARYRRKKDAERPRHRLLPVHDRQFDRKLPAMQRLKPAGFAILAPRSKRMFSGSEQGAERASPASLLAPSAIVFPPSELSLLARRAEPVRH